jgi:uncharacterized protein YndB with AHSA1/START domain
MPFVEFSDFSAPPAPWSIRRRELIAVAPERVWKALTCSGELTRWWCDGARVEARKGGEYRFWGATVYGGGAALRDPASEPAGAFEILEIEPPWRLGYRWWLHGVETRVRIEVASHLEESVIGVSQWGDRPPGPAGSGGPNWWWIALPALRSYLEDSKADLRLDYPRLRAAPMLRLETAVTTFPWIIWSKLTLPEELARWWGSSPEVELAPGGAFRLGPEVVGPERILELVPERLLAHDWRWEDGTLGRLQWTLEETDEETRVALVDAGPWPAAAERDSLAILRGSTLLALQQMSEKGITPREYQDD